jgi:hypothetical protein
LMFEPPKLWEHKVLHKEPGSHILLQSWRGDLYIFSN